MKIQDLENLSMLLHDNSSSDMELTALTICLNREHMMELEDELKNELISVEVRLPDNHISQSFLKVRAYGITFNIVKQA